MTELRTPDEIQGDFAKMTGPYSDVDGPELFALIHEVIEDINSSWNLALESAVPTDGGDDIISACNSAVLDYVTNHYGEN